MNALPQYDRIFQALGEILEVQGEEIGIVIAGGLALKVLGIVDRTTSDLDVLAIGDLSGEDVPTSIRRPDSMPPGIQEAIRRVARDFGLPDDWLNTDVAAQWETSLPPGLEDRITWHKYAALHVGVISRQDLIAFKLYAAVDRTKESVHYKDLVALAPTDAELEFAERWITEDEDPSPVIRDQLQQVIRELKHDVGQRD